jgi:hypothetical protein
VPVEVFDAGVACGAARMLALQATFSVSLVCPAPSFGCLEAFRLEKVGGNLERRDGRAYNVCAYGWLLDGLVGARRRSVCARRIGHSSSLRSEMKTPGSRRARRARDPGWAQALIAAFTSYCRKLQV